MCLKKPSCPPLWWWGGGAFQIVGLSSSNSTVMPLMLYFYHLYISFSPKVLSLQIAIRIYLLKLYGDKEISSVGVTQGQRQQHKTFKEQ